MKNIYISDLKPGTNLLGEDFAVKKISQKTTKDGRNYLDLELSDNTGSAKAKVWPDNLSETTDLAEGTIVTIDGKIDTFQDAIQIIVSKATKAEKFNPADFSACTSFDIDQMWSELTDYRKKVKNKHLKNLLDNVFSEEITANFKHSAAAYTVHHAYVGGLLEHTLEMLKLTDGIFERYPKVNKDILIAGIILHDIGKIFEYDTDLVVKLTTEGKLLGHIYMGSSFVEKAADKDMPKILLDEIIHIILSHHGDLEFGSPVKPRTPEAITISMLDNTSAKLNMSYSYVHQLENGVEFTSYHRQLGTELYRSPFLDNSEEDLPF